MFPRIFIRYEFKLGYSTANLLVIATIIAVQIKKFHLTLQSHGHAHHLIHFLSKEEGGTPYSALKVLEKWEKLSNPSSKIKDDG